MRVISCGFTALFFIAGVSAAGAQSIPLPLPLNPANELQERPPILQSMPPIAVAIPNTVQEIRDAILALRRACVDLPSTMYLDPTGRPGPVIHPFAVEDDACAMVSNPSRYIEAYAWPMGMMGGAIALLGLGLFAVIGGMLRLAWYGPLNRYRQRQWTNI